MLPCFLIPACVSWINPCLAIRTRLDYCSCYWTTPLLKPSGYCSPIKDPCTLVLGLLFVLPVLYLFADVLTLPVFLTTSWNKACKWIFTSRSPCYRILGHKRIQQLFKWTLARYGHSKTAVRAQAGHSITRELYSRVFRDR